MGKILELVVCCIAVTKNILSTCGCDFPLQLEANVAQIPPAVSICIICWFVVFLTHLVHCLRSDVLELRRLLAVLASDLWLLLVSMSQYQAINYNI